MRVIEYFYGFFERRISPIPSSYPDDEIIGEGLIRYKAIEFVTDICHELLYALWVLQSWTRLMFRAGHK